MGKNGPDLDDYLQKGIYGTKETKADERGRFLGTLRERIVIALYEDQVYEPGVYPEVEREMGKHPKARLLLNGEITYEYLSKYVRIANKRGIPFTIVEDLDDDTDIGLVLTYDHAIDREDIFVTKKGKKPTASSTGQGEGQTGWKGIWKKLLK